MEDWKRVSVPSLLTLFLYLAFDLRKREREGKGGREGREGWRGRERMVEMVERERENDRDGGEGEREW
jgi:hypothetical protein